MHLPPIAPQPRPTFAGMSEATFPPLSDDLAEDRRLRIAKHKEKVQGLVERYTRTQALARGGQSLPGQYLSGLGKELVEHARALNQLLDAPAFHTYLKETIEERLINSLPELQTLFTEATTHVQDASPGAAAPQPSHASAWKAKLLQLRQKFRRSDD